jgi:dihydrofolate reductase
MASAGGSSAALTLSWSVSLKANVRHEILVGGPELASYAFKAGLVDKCHLLLFPIIVGGGKKSLPDDVRLRLELEDQRRFSNGTIFLSYACKV